jgi:hypothetical protein
VCADVLCRDATEAGMGTMGEGRRDRGRAWIGVVYEGRKRLRWERDAGSVQVSEGGTGTRMRREGAGDGRVEGKSGKAG